MLFSSSGIIINPNNKKLYLVFSNKGKNIFILILNHLKDSFENLINISETTKW